MTLCLVSTGSAGAQTGAADGQWHHYAGDHGSTKYAPLDQIDAENFAALEVVWRWQSVDTELADKIKAEFGRTPRVEGLPTADWVLIDAGDVIVHLFRPEVRSFYNLERMWSFGEAGQA
ncbi:MAG: ribosome silencing factor [Proteobacteria bacterium]|nr:ribosome silencing factor [Pseudomonadota bacterium]